MLPHAQSFVGSLMYRRHASQCLDTRLYTANAAVERKTKQHAVAGSEVHEAKSGQKGALTILSFCSAFALLPARVLGTGLPERARAD